MPLFRRSLTPQEKMRALLKLKKKEVRKKFLQGQISYNDYVDLKKSLKILIKRTKPGLFGKYRVASVDASHLDELLFRVHGVRLGFSPGTKIHLYYRPFSRVSYLESAVMNLLHGVNPPVGKIAGANLLHSVMTEDLPKLFGAREEAGETPVKPSEGPSYRRLKIIRKPIISAKGISREKIGAVVEETLKEQGVSPKSVVPITSEKAKVKTVKQKTIDDFSKGARKRVTAKRTQLSLDDFIESRGKVIGRSKVAKGKEQKETKKEEVKKAEKKPLTPGVYVKEKIKAATGKAKTAGAVVKEAGKAVAYDIDYVRLESEARKLGVLDKYKSALDDLAYTENINERRKIVRRLEAEFKLIRKLKRMNISMEEFSRFFGLEGKKVSLTDFEEKRKDLSKMRLIEKKLMTSDVLSKREFLNAKQLLEKLDRKYDGHFYTQFLLAKLHEKVGNWSEARKYYASAERKVSEHKDLKSFVSKIREHKKAFEAMTKQSKPEKGKELSSTRDKEKVVLETFKNNKQLGLGEIESVSEIREKLSAYPHLLSEMEEIIGKSKTDLELKRELNKFISSKLGPIKSVVESGKLKKIEEEASKTGHPDLLLAKGNKLYEQDKLKALMYFRELEKSGKDKTGYSAYMVGRILAERGEVQEALNFVRSAKSKYTHPQIYPKLSELEVQLMKRESELLKAKEADERRLSEAEKKEVVLDFFKRVKEWGLSDASSVDEIREHISRAYPDISNRLEQIMRNSKTEKDLRTNLNGFLFDYHNVLVNHKKAIEAVGGKYGSDNEKRKKLEKVYRETRHPLVKEELDKLRVKAKVQDTIRRTNNILSEAGEWGAVVRSTDVILKYSLEPEKYTTKEGTLDTLIEGTISKSKIARELAKLKVPVPEKDAEALLKKESLKRAKDFLTSVKRVASVRDVAGALDYLSNVTGMSKEELTSKLHSYLRDPTNKDIIKLVEGVGAVVRELGAISKSTGLQFKNVNFKLIEQRLGSFKFKFGSYMLPIDRAEVRDALEKAVKGDTSQWHRLVDKISAFSELNSVVTKLMDKSVRKFNLNGWEHALYYLPTTVKTAEEARKLSSEFKSKIKIARQLNELGVPVPWEGGKPDARYLNDAIKFLNENTVKVAKLLVNQVNSSYQLLGKGKKVSTIREVIDLLSKPFEGSVVSKEEYQTLVKNLVLASLVSDPSKIKKQLKAFTDYATEAKQILDSKTKLSHLSEELVMSKVDRSIADGWARLVMQTPEWKQITEIINNFGDLSSATEALDVLQRKTEAVKKLAKLGLPPRKDVIMNVDELERYAQSVEDKLEEAKKALDEVGYKVTDFSDVLDVLRVNPAFDAEEVIWSYLKGEISVDTLKTAAKSITYRVLLGGFEEGEDKEFIKNLTSYKRVIMKKPELVDNLIRALDDDIKRADNLRDLDSIFPKLERAMLLVEDTDYEDEIHSRVDKVISKYNDIVGSRLKDAYQGFLETGEARELLGVLSNERDVSSVEDMVRTLSFLRDYSPEVYEKYNLDDVHRLARAAIAGNKNLASAYVMDKGGVVLDSLVSVMDKPKFLNKLRAEMGEDYKIVEDAIDVYTRIREEYPDHVNSLPEVMTRDVIDEINRKIELLANNDVKEDLFARLGLDNDFAKGTLIDHLVDRLETLYGVTGLFDKRISYQQLERELNEVIRNKDEMIKLHLDDREKLAEELSKEYPGHKLLALPTSVIVPRVGKILKQSIAEDRKEEKRRVKELKKSKKIEKQMSEVLTEDAVGNEVIKLNKLLELDKIDVKGRNVLSSKLRKLADVHKFFKEEVVNSNLPEEYIQADLLPGLLRYELTFSEYENMKKRLDQLKKLNGVRAYERLKIPGIESPETMLDVLADRLYDRLKKEGRQLTSLLDIHQVPDSIIQEELGKVNRIITRLSRESKDVIRDAVEYARNVHQKNILELDVSTVNNIIEYVKGDMARTKGTKGGKGKKTTRKKAPTDDILAELEEIEGLTKEK